MAAVVETDYSGTETRFLLASAMAAGESGAALSPEVAQWLCQGIARAIHAGTSLDVGLGLKLPGTRRRSILQGARQIARNALLADAGDKLTGSARERAREMHRRLLRLQRGSMPRDDADVRLRAALRYGPVLSVESIRRVLG